MSTEESPCGLDAALAVVGGKWKPLILYHLNSGPKRFGELKRLVVGRVLTKDSSEAFSVSGVVRGVLQVVQQP